MSTHEKRQYGNFRRPRTAGLAGMNKEVTIALVLQVAVGFVLAMLTNIYVLAVVVVYLTIFTALMSVSDRHGITPMTKLSERLRFMFSRRKGWNTYRAPVETGHTPPPSILTATRVSEHYDGYGRPFGLLHFEHTSQVSVMLVCNPIGGELHDEDTIDTMVAAWGGFGAMFATQSGVDQYTATVEVGPNFGYSATNAVEEFIDPDAPELAQEITRGTTLLGAQTKTSAKSYVSVTFSIPAEAVRATKDPAVLDELTAADVARRLPVMIERLKAAGGGGVRPATPGEVAEHVRVAYDPTLAKSVETARAAKNPMLIDWDDAGPASADAQWDSYVHDSGYSVTFRMTNGPRGTITADSLRSLIGPHPHIHRKRVTLVRHVIDSGRAADIAEWGFNNARVKAESRRATAADLTDRNIAQHVRNEVSSGASIEDFTVLITITVLDPAKLPDAVAAIEHQLAPTARIVTRIMYGAQEVGFIGALGIGADLRAFSPYGAIQKAMS